MYLVDKHIGKAQLQWESEKKKLKQLTLIAFKKNPKNWGDLT